MNKAEDGSILVEAIWVMTILAMIGSALLYVMLSEREAIGGIELSDGALVEAEGMVERTRLLISRPPDAGGWGDAFTTAPSAESVDVAIEHAHFISMDAGKVIVQRTARPLERRITAIVDHGNSESHGSKIVQALVQLKGRADAGAGTGFGISIVPADGLQQDDLDVPGSIDRQLKLSNTEISGTALSEGINSMWLDDDVTVTLDGVSMDGDAFSHESVALTGKQSTVTGGALISFESVLGKELLSGEIIEGYSAGKHDSRFIDIVTPGIESRSYYKGVASALISSSTSLCADDMGGLHADPQGDCTPSDLNLVRDRWGEPLLDGTVFVEGDVVISGTYAGSLSVVAGGAACELPCGEVNIGNKRNDGDLSALSSHPDNLGIQSADAALSLIGGTIGSVTSDRPEIVAASLYATTRIELASDVVIASPALRITQPMRSSHHIELGSIGQPISLSLSRIAAFTPLEDYRVGEVATEITAWHEVLPSKQRRKLLSK